MLEKLFLAGILTFTLSLFTQGHRSSPLGMTPKLNSVGITQQIDLHYKMVLSLNQPPEKKLNVQNSD